MTTRSCFALLVGLAVAFGASPAAGQVAIGVSAGPSFATLYGDDIEGDEMDGRTSIFVGATVGFPITDVVSIGSGVFYVQKGGTDNQLGGSGEISLDYIEIPALVQLTVTQPEASIGFSLMAGPTFGFESSCEIPDDPLLCDDLISLDIGAVFGGGLNFSAGENLAFYVDGGVDLGLRTLDNSTEFANQDVKNRVVFLGVGLNWFVGG